MKYFIPLLSILFLASCNSSPSDQISFDTVANKDTTAQTEGIKAVLSHGLTMWSNIEQIEYCVPVPTSEYALDSLNEYERAKFVFKCKANDKYQIILQGLNRSDTKVTLEEYFEHSYPVEQAEGGKNVERKEMIPSRNCFYAKGSYTSTSMDTRFMEVTWLRTDEVISFKATYDIKDTALWERRLKQILLCDSYCK